MQTQNTLESYKEAAIREWNKRVKDGVLERQNCEVLEKLIHNAQSLEEAQAINALGTYYKRTGFHFDVRLEKTTNDVHYLKKNEDLSFNTAPNALTHTLIIGDNYPALQNLLINYEGKIKVIYIDPPYGKDDMGEFAATNYDNAITRDNLLSMLKPRLELAKMLLKDEGVIFCSIDDRNQAYLKCLFDEVFGERNFVANFIWHSKNKPSGNTSGKARIDTRTEYILCYIKDKEDLAVNKEINSKEELTRKGYVLKDEFFETRGYYKLIPLMHSCSASSFDYIESLDYEIQAPDGTMFKNHQNIKKPKSYRYTWSKKVFDFGKENGFVEIQKTIDKKTKEVFWCAYIKMYELCKIDSKRLEIIYRLSGISYNNLLLDVAFSDDGANEVRDILNAKIFSYAKPVNLIKRLLEISTTENCEDNDDEPEIILDFFAGSGTTAHAVMELNRIDGGKRRCILVNEDEITDTTPKGIAHDVTSKRLKRIMTGACYDGNTDFKWLEKNKPYGDNLVVYEIDKISKFDVVGEKNIFDAIDEQNYGLKKFETAHEKALWIAENFKRTLTQLDDEDYLARHAQENAQNNAGDAQ